jgi:ubiquinone/menaquinone biosynthesis C-methylase UbiE
MVGTWFARLQDKYTIFTRTWFSNRPDTVIDLPSNTVEQNRLYWNNYDWSELGEEWTSTAKKNKGIEPEYWKRSLIDHMLLKYIREGSTILEIGPGAGRWSETLQRLANKLILADISQTCLDICEKRYNNCNNIEYYLIADQGLAYIPDESVDYIWSYDVFVHINPSDIERYIFEIKRILKSGGYTIIHHTGDRDLTSTTLRRYFGQRTFMNSNLFTNLVKAAGLNIVEQNTDLVHKRGDVISVFYK